MPTWEGKGLVVSYPRRRVGRGFRPLSRRNGRGFKFTPSSPLPAWRKASRGNDLNFFYQQCHHYFSLQKCPREVFSLIEVSHPRINGQSGIAALPNLDSSRGNELNFFSASIQALDVEFMRTGIDRWLGRKQRFCTNLFQGEGGRRAAEKAKEFLCSFVL